jgi:hypothetical protein
MKETFEEWSERMLRNGTPLEKPPEPKPKRPWTRQEKIAHTFVAVVAVAIGVTMTIESNTGDGEPSFVLDTAMLGLFLLAVLTPAALGWLQHRKGGPRNRHARDR